MANSLSRKRRSAWPARGGVNERAFKPICEVVVTINPSNEKFETTRIEAAHHQVHTEILIEAASEKVWKALTDFAAMPGWSSSFKGIIGDFIDGANVQTRFDLGDGVEAYSATLRVTDQVEFGWSEDYDGIRDNHRYCIETIGPRQTKFIQSDAFRGQADWTTTAELAETYLAQYVAFNRALKSECERLFGPI